MPFTLGQRWISDTESELGLGTVVALDARMVTLLFPAIGENRLYSRNDSPITRVMFNPGDTITSHEGWQLHVDKVNEENGLLSYTGTRLDTQEANVTLREVLLDSKLVFSKPQDRLFAGQIDRMDRFALRYRARKFQSEQYRMPWSGLRGQRTSLIPHQLHIAHDVGRRHAPRVLLADEVGLGKTIEAGMILHQQLLSGAAERVLIVVPETLQHQWLVEMLRRFNLRFSLFDDERYAEAQHDAYNPFETEQLVICSLDFVRRSKQRLEHLCDAEWDLMVVDEAHHLVWSEEAPSREYQAIEQLAERVPGILLLTATPEQLGMESHFARLRLLDPNRFHDFEQFVEEQQNYRPVADAVALLLAQPVLAKDIPLNRAAALANSVTPAASSQAYDDLEQQALAQLRHALQGNAATLTRDRLAHTKQNQTQADTAWLKASGYDFQTRANQQAGIALLSAFSTLPETVVKQNLATVTAINRDAVQTTRRQALADAEGISYLYFLSDALGPRLGKAFLTAYDQGALGKAAALIKASEVSTGEAKKHFNNPRPFLVQGNTIHLVPDDVVVKDNQPYTADGGSFPSGPTNTGYTDALLLAAMIPERYDALVARGARYGYSRIVLGVHYPLDVIGSRMVAERNVAHYLNDPHYRVLFNEARDQLRAALAKACGTSLAECAKSSVKDDPWRDPAMRDFSRFTMTYDLPQQKGPQPRLQVPEGAEVLLEDALPHLSAAQRRALMVNTALPAGYPLSGTTPEQQFWQRLNLSAAWEMAQKGINVVSGTLHCVSRFSGNGRTYRSNTQADAPPVIEIPPTIPHSRSHA